MIRVFVDTSYYVAAVNARDAMHRAALEFARSYTGAMLTTEFVLIEVGNWLARSGDRVVFVDLLRQLRADPQVTVLPASPVLFERGLSLYTRRPDKDWSLTDCISLVVMEEHGLRDALTADHHFEQAGFTILLK